ncbi:helix-turn-helix transcriptional regulator [Hymenobacter canadensis]|uniref:helix-turn-helix transcriptional regulator n=1 Tax=Hymenobacter canadensis TaxID=2999067 RepID=UPI0033142490
MYPMLGNRAILVAAPPSLFRTGLITTIRETWPSYSMRVTADSSQLPLLVQQHPHALLILDCIKAREAFVSLTQLRQTHQSLPVLALCGPHVSATLSQQLHQAGIGAWLSYTSPPATVREVVKKLLQDTYPKIGTESRPPRLLPPPTPFTQREIEILRLVVADMCNLEIASHLCLSVRTVESHRRALLQKAGAKTLVGLVVRAITQGWVGSEMITASVMIQE